MGGATAYGLNKAVLAGTFSADLEVTARHAETLAPFAACGIATSLDNPSAASAADVLMLAVKPWMVKAVLEELDGLLSGKLLISLAAGVPDDDLLSFTGGAGLSAVYVAIPNLAAEVGESMTFVHKLAGSQASDAAVKSIFDAIGTCRFVEGRQLKAGMMLASCGLAYALRYIRASVEGGVELGMYPRDAQDAVVQTLRGAADLLEARGSHPEREIDRVTTPGGITIRGLNAMEEAGFSSAVVKGLKI